MPLLVLEVLVLLVLLALLVVVVVVVILVMLLLMLLVVALLVGVPLLFGSPFFCVWLKIESSSSCPLPFEMTMPFSPSSPLSLSWVGGFDFPIAEQAPSQFGAAVLLL